MITFENRRGSDRVGSREAMSTRDEVAAKFNDWEETALTWIRQYPAYAVGIAVTIGVTFGWLLKRR